MAGAGEPLCVIIGGGGHARVLIDVMADEGGIKPGGILDKEPSLRGGDVAGVPVLGDESELAGLAAKGFGYFAVGIGSVRAGGKRRRLYELGLAHGLQPLTVQHPRAVCSRRSAIGAGSQIMPLAVVNTLAQVGVNCIVNSGAVVEHDCAIAGHVHIAPGAVLSGGVRVGEGAHIGAGSTVVQGVEIGAGSTVGAGAVVVRDVADGTTVVGVPARPH